MGVITNLVDNFDAIERDILRFDSEDDVYFVQVLKRRKENPDMDTNCRVISQYIIHSIEELHALRDTIIEKCKTHNARAYINPNRRSKEKIALELLKLTANRIAEKQYKGLENDFYRAVGQVGANGQKMWIVDVDMKEGDLDALTTIYILSQYLTGLKPDVGTSKVVTIVPTLNGFHIITRPFDIQTFKEMCGENIPDIHKNNPTLLWVEKK